LATSSLIRAILASKSSRALHFKRAPESSIHFFSLVFYLLKA
jgi:hypothetical protein